MAGDFSPETLRARFHAATAEREKIAATAAPVRAERDRISAELDTKVRALNAQLKVIEAPLFDLDNERAAISRALNGKTGL